MLNTLTYKSQTQYTSGETGIPQYKGKRNEQSSSMATPSTLSQKGYNYKTGRTQIGTVQNDRSADNYSLLVEGYYIELH